MPWYVPIPSLTVDPWETGSLTCRLYLQYAALLGWPSGNSVYTGEMLLNAAGADVTRFNQRAIGVGVVTFALFIHGVTPKWGIRLQNALGIFKIGVLVFIICSGFAALAGVSSSSQRLLTHTQTLTVCFFMNVICSMLSLGRPTLPTSRTLSLGLSRMPTLSSTLFIMVSCFYRACLQVINLTNAPSIVIWSFIGYSNAFYAMSEIRSPIKTVKIAAPVAILLVSVLYMLVNIAFMAAVPKDVIMTSERLLAAEFFTRVSQRSTSWPQLAPLTNSFIYPPQMFGEKAAQAVSVCIALSAIGNVLSVLVRCSLSLASCPEADCDSSYHACFCTTVLARSYQSRCALIPRCFVVNRFLLTTNSPVFRTWPRGRSSLLQLLRFQSAVQFAPCRSGSSVACHACNHSCRPVGRCVLVPSQ